VKSCPSVIERQNEEEVCRDDPIELRLRPNLDWCDHFRLGRNIRFASIAIFRQEQKREKSIFLTCESCGDQSTRARRLRFALLLFFLTVGIAVKAWDSTPVILSTDIGNEIDDQWAVAYMLTNADFDVLGIVSAHAPSCLTLQPITAT
jgi:hypothetical protein